MDTSLVQDMGHHNLQSAKATAVLEMFQLSYISDSLTGIAPILPSQPLGLDASLVQDMEC
jgi:hypothetical protein